MNAKGTVNGTVLKKCTFLDKLIIDRENRPPDWSFRADVDRISQWLLGVGLGPSGKTGPPAAFLLLCGRRASLR